MSYVGRCGYHSFTAEGTHAVALITVGVADTPHQGGSARAGRSKTAWRGLSCVERFAAHPNSRAEQSMLAMPACIS
ncbi:hypothetical protein [Nocardia jiangxiensis]|uniref:Uncharacterized protein n=1 Tax=Nocardia jiangxiensis TaxID=282685 RepID=A0ABW6RTY6_9NOCA|nr:hypothetical protein [Nocardia jiangxiensis]